MRQFVEEDKDVVVTCDKDGAQTCLADWALAFEYIKKKKNAEI